MTVHDADRLKGEAALAALEAQGKLFCYAADVSDIFGKDLRTVYLAMDRGEIPFTKIGQRKQIPVAWVRRQVDGVDAPAASASRSTSPTALMSRSWM